MFKSIRQRAGARLLQLTASSLGLLTVTLPLTGCLVHTHTVLKTRRPDVVMNASVDDLLKQVDARYNAIQSMTAIVTISYSTGGSLQGLVKESTPFDGAIVIGKPENIRVFLQVPVLRSKAVDMVSDGNQFKMLVTIPSVNCAIVGSDQSQPSQKGLYALRPAVILDSLLIKGLQPDQVVALTQDDRIVPNPVKKKDLIEEPDYELQFLSKPEGTHARVLHVLHIGRSTLLPYQHDIYDADGKVVTQATYSNYTKFGDIQLPAKIEIKRPLDELGLTITITRATFNQKLPADQFALEIPEGIATQNMDDPASAKSNPCVSHETQSPS